MARPFEWGVHDCVMLAADCVEACTGVDPAFEMRGTYSTAMTAGRLVESRGGLHGIAAAALGNEIAVRMAQPGDIGLVSSGGRECLAVCTGQTWHAPAEVGLIAVPIECGLRAWRLVRKQD